MQTSKISFLCILIEFFNKTWIRKLAFIIDAYIDNKCIDRVRVGFSGMIQVREGRPMRVADATRRRIVDIGAATVT